jgi:2-keto-4-pentenoate hydratase/2-oxohepta-3-ene-1,7-dioic acid hydratase in catechol pathway
LTEQRIARIQAGGEELLVRWPAAVEPHTEFEILQDDLFDNTVRPSGHRVQCDRTVLLPPVAPRKIFGVGANFAGDPESPSKELPSIFSMPVSAITAGDACVVLPELFDSVLVEGELAVVIGKLAKNLDDGKGSSVILGFTIANDLSGRASTGPLAAFTPPALKKGSDGFLPLGPCIAIGLPWKTLSLSTTINGAIAQKGRLADLMFSCERVVEFVSRFIALEPGDVIAMGTPPPKPKAQRGDILRVAIEGIGVLENSLA